MEFDLINRYFLPLGQTLAAGELGIGDDGALLDPPEGTQLVVVTDTLVSGVHFPETTPPFDIGWKALAVNLSDLAAMGARPAFYSLGLTLPEVDSPWLSGFVNGLWAVSMSIETLKGQKSVCPLIGGDTTRGPLTITITAQGWVAKGKALRRQGAQPGDAIFVSGTIGEAGLGLDLVMNQQSVTHPHDLFALNRLNRPEPRVALGQALIGLATSCIDVSDGLLADLNHLLVASRVGAKLESQKMPLSSAVATWAIDNPIKPLCSGDDYELCFTVPAERVKQVSRLSVQLGLRLSCIGQITAEQGCWLDDRAINARGNGFDHFR